MTNEEKAVKLAEESIKRFGFVVCGHEPTHNAIGVPTDVLWKIYEMPQPFVAVRIATPAEWKRQQDLASSIFGKKVKVPPTDIPLVMVTD